MSYRVLVDDNYHYMDESQRWTQSARDLALTLRKK